MLTIEEIRTGTEERAENIAFTANKDHCNNTRNISKKATLDQACVIIVTNQDIGSRKAAKPNEKYTGRKEEALIEAMSAEYNLENFSDA
ncbi:hypothetical protein APICC_02471 [Apis cerana cerana]|uniref:Uncharacterized protein n=1 Tax=Apis cerana cerana TaxID=94128 RepID=A0A2A3DZV4_APICC|nr:hypothetical protein APICC_02471 [Apis cerana cerana]